ncbi:hypothetical protein MnTg02_00732 [bacterium MnTg02]|nr:hypothetical protein MnTg02_00732 [bacterium MnTg02]
MGVQAPRRLMRHKARRAVALAKGNYKSIIISFGMTQSEPRSISLFLNICRAENRPHSPIKPESILFLKML